MSDPKKLDVEELRAWANDPMCFPRYFTFDRASLRFLADAIEIADSTARADIECNLPYEGKGATIWYDTTLVASDDCYMIDQAIAYLEARGNLTRKPDAPHMIRPWGEDGR
jgi:hypothetical protein